MVLIEKVENEDKGLTSLVVEIDEHDRTKRIYWVKNDDLTAEIAEEKGLEEAPENQFDGDEEDPDDNEDDNEVDDGIFDITTPMKRSNKSDDEDYVPSEKEKRPVKKAKTVSQIVKKKSLGEGSALKITDVSSPKPKGAKHFTDEKGYVYYQRSITSCKRQLKCVFANVSKFKCTTTASMALDPPDSPIVISWKSNPHNHPPENEKTVASKFSKCLKKRVLEEPDVPVKKIYDDEKKKCPSGAEALPENIALQRMRRYRRLHSRSSQSHSDHTDPLSDDEEPQASKELQMLSEGKIIYVDGKGYQYRHQFASIHKRPTSQQITTLLKFIEENPVLLTGKLLNDESGRARFTSLWKDLKTRMSSIEGPSKTVKQWQKFWRALQLKAKRKAAFVEKKAKDDLDSRIASMVQIALDSMSYSERSETSHVPVVSNTDNRVDPIPTSKSVAISNVPSESSVEFPGYGMVSMVQKGILVGFMEINESLRNVDVCIPKETLNDEELGKWLKLVACLNSCGPEKSSEVWGKIWTEMKSSALAEWNSASAAGKISTTPCGLDGIDARVINCLATSKYISSYEEQQPQQIEERAEIPLDASNLPCKTSVNDFPGPKNIQKEQKDAMIDFLEKNKEMLRPKSFCGGPNNTTYRWMWADLAKLLNSLPGPKNSVQKWRRCLACYKLIARRKLNMPNGKPCPTKHCNYRYNPMTKFEKRLLELDKYVKEAGSCRIDTSLLAKDTHEGASTSNVGLISDTSTTNKYWGKRMRSEQKDAMIDFLEKNKEILRDPEGPRGAPYKKMWDRLANLLNSLPGPKNSVIKWKQGLSCLKSVARRKQNMADGKKFPSDISKFRYISTFEKRLLALEKYVHESCVNTGTDETSLDKVIHESATDTSDVFDNSEVDGDGTIDGTGEPSEEKGTPTGRNKRQTFSVADESNNQPKGLNVSNEQSSNISTQDQFKVWEEIREEQKSALIDYLEKHKELCRETMLADCDVVARGNMWADLTILLNSLPGPKHSITEWQQCLASYKSEVHKKQRMVEGQMTAGSSSTDRLLHPLTCFEERLLAFSRFLSVASGNAVSSPAKVIRDPTIVVGKSELDVAISSSVCNRVGTRDSVEKKDAKTTKTLDSGIEQKHPVALNQLIMVDDSKELLTRDQADYMVEFIQANPSCDLYKWDEDKTNFKLVPFWEYLCKKLNKLGPQKDRDGWKKCWCLFKDSTYKKSLMEKELSSLEVQILKFAKSKPAIVVQEDRKDVVLVKEIVRKTLPGDCEVSVVDRANRSSYGCKEDSSPQKLKDSLPLTGCKAIRKRRMTSEQKSTMIEFLMRHPFAQNFRGGTPTDKQKYLVLWEELSEKLNSHQFGTQKSSFEWRRCWTDLKSTVIRKVKKGTEKLTKLETKIWRMKCSDEEVADPLSLPNPPDTNMITVNVEDLQNAINQSINVAGGSGIVLTFDSFEPEV